MLDRVAASVQGPVQADAVIGVARDFLPPAVGLVDDRADLFERQRRLREEIPTLVEPRSVCHVDLDPVGAVIELLAGRLSRLDRTVHDLGAFRDLDLGRIALEVVAPGGRDRPRHHEHPRARDVSLLDRLLDADVAVPRAFRLDVADRRETLRERPARRHGRPGRAEREAVHQELRVVATLGGILSLEKDVRVAVDQPGQDGRSGEVDRGRAGGNLRGGRVAHRLDPVAADDDHLIAPRGRGPAVDERPRADDRDGVGPGGGLRESGGRYEERESPD